MSGDSNIKYLNDHGVTIWDEWADENGDLGPVYGSQWRNWGAQKRWKISPVTFESYEAGSIVGIDQIAQIVDKLKTNPLDRRLIVSAWNVAEIPNMKLPPCHYAFQFYVRPLTTEERLTAASILKRFDPKQQVELQNLINHRTSDTVAAFLDQHHFPQYELSLLLNQRSCDIGLGVPFNIAQYGFMLRMFCEVANMTPGEFIWNGGDTHIYVNHIKALEEQLERTPYTAPTFQFARKITDIDDFKYEDFVIDNYTSHPAIKMEVAV